MKSEITETFDFVNSFNIEVFAITETWPNTTDKLHFPKYKIYINDREGVRGGVESASKSLFSIQHY